MALLILVPEKNQMRTLPPLSWRGTAAQGT
jgi:hypothetical protein